MKILLVLFFMLTSCGVQEFDIPSSVNKYPCKMEFVISGGVEQGTGKQLASFLADATRYEATCYPIIGITFVDSFNERSIVGRCDVGNAVFLHKDYWFFSSEQARLITMYHELGHCLLGLPHDDSKPDIMNKYLLDPRYAKKNWTALVNNLFTKVK